MPDIHVLAVIRFFNVMALYLDLDVMKKDPEKVLYQKSKNTFPNGKNTVPKRHFYATKPGF